MRLCFLSVGSFGHIAPYLDFFHSAGHDVHFVALAGSVKRNVPTYNVGLITKWLRPSGKWAYLLAMVMARRVIRQIRPDVVHAHYATSGGLAACISGFHPYIVTAHGTDVAAGVKSPFRRALLERVFAHADCVNPVSPELHELVASLGVADAKVRTFTLGVDTRVFCLASHSPALAVPLLRCICTRRLEDIYDHSSLIKGIAILRERHVPVQLTVVGEGPLKRSLERLAANEGVAREVRFVGPVPHASIPSLLKAHDIYLSACWWDGTSLSLLEAMASGLYPVVSRIRANSDWVEHGRNGLLHEVSDPHEVAECLASLRDNPEKLESARAYNRQLVLRKGDRETNMRRLERLYYELKTRHRMLDGHSGEVNRFEDRETHIVGL